MLKIRQIEKMFSEEKFSLASEAIKKEMQAFESPELFYYLFLAENNDYSGINPDSVNAEIILNKAFEKANLRQKEEFQCEYGFYTMLPVELRRIFCYAERGNLKGFKESFDAACKLEKIEISMNDELLNDIDFILNFKARKDTIDLECFALNVLMLYAPDEALSTLFSTLKDKALELESKFGEAELKKDFCSLEKLVREIQAEPEVTEKGTVDAEITADTGITFEPADVFESVPVKKHHDFTSLRRVVLSPFLYEMLSLAVSVVLVILTLIPMTYPGYTNTVMNFWKFLAVKGLTYKTILAFIMVFAPVFYDVLCYLKKWQKKRSVIQPALEIVTLIVIFIFERRLMNVMFYCCIASKIFFLVMDIVFILLSRIFFPKGNLFDEIEIDRKQMVLQQLLPFVAVLFVSLFYLLTSKVPMYNTKPRGSMYYMNLDFPYVLVQESASVVYFLALLLPLAIGVIAYKRKYKVIWLVIGGIITGLSIFVFLFPKGFINYAEWPPFYRTGAWLYSGFNLLLWIIQLLCTIVMKNQEDIISLLMSWLFSWKAIFVLIAIVISAVMLGGSAALIYLFTAGTGQWYSYIYLILPLCGDVGILHAIYEKMEYKF